MVARLSMCVCYGHPTNYMCWIWSLDQCNHRHVVLPTETSKLLSVQHRATCTGTQCVANRHDIFSFLSVLPDGHMDMPVRTVGGPGESMLPSYTRGSLSLSIKGVGAKAWCLLKHAEASLSLCKTPPFRIMKLASRSVPAFDTGESNEEGGGADHPREGDACYVSPAEPKQTRRLV